MVLHPRGYQCAVQQDEPGEINGEHEDGQEGQFAAIGFGVPSFLHYDVGNIKRAGEVIHLPKGAGYQPAPTGSDPWHLGVGDELVQAGEPGDGEEQRHGGVAKAAG